MSLRILSDRLPAKGCLQCNAYRSQFSLSMLALFCWFSIELQPRDARCKGSGATAPEWTYSNEGDN